MSISPYAHPAWSNLPLEQLLVIGFQAYNQEGASSETAAAAITRACSAPLQDAIAHDEMKALLGHTVEVVVAGPSMKTNAILKGRTRSWKNVFFPGGFSLIGTLQHVVLHSFTNQTFIGSSTTYKVQKT